MFVEHKEAIEITPAPAKVLKLSEAMRIGAKIRPQAKGRLFDAGASCALGAAYEGAFGAPPAEVWGKDYNDAGNALTDCWMRLMDRYPGQTAGIFTKNDFLGMSREEIADWLEAQGY